MTQKQLTLGVRYTPDPGEPIATTVRAAQEIEAMGYSSFALPDHLTRPHGDEVAPVSDPLLLLARIAADTTHLPLATTALLGALRSPDQTLRAAATLQHITGGRLALGLGASWQNADLDTLPSPLRAAPARIAALEEVLRLLRQAWPIDNAAVPETDRARVLAAGTPAPRLLVAAGSNRMLHLAARYADTIALTDRPHPAAPGRSGTHRAVGHRADRHRPRRPPRAPAPPRASTCSSARSPPRRPTAATTTGGGPAEARPGSPTPSSAASLPGSPTSPCAPRT
ncbi:LLM class flavin-dependent oxidoreductase [Kitasatospora sp. NPDC057965]|uniref:LLM class flavin-dependent oxidoreductase n=1 Tax=Kitasatospora sp. NPDC057965 TaxID=3346291 RepID=UPI0036D7A51E